MRRSSLVLVVLGLLSACERAGQSTYDAHGPAAAKIVPLSWLMTVLFSAITVMMWVLIFWAARRRRGTLEEHEPVDANGGQAWIAIGGLAFPAVVLTVLFVLGLGLLAQFPVHSAEQHAMRPDIVVIGHQWWWEVQYLRSPNNLQFTTANEIHIPTGQGIDIQLDSQDVMHSFWVPALHGKVDMVPGHTNYIRLEASAPGDYQGQCAEFCGAQHAHMRLVIVAQPPEAYAAWLAEEQKPASRPATQLADAGQHLFETGPCSMCHQIRGTSAGGHVAPDLTHLASRHYIAGNSFPNTDAYLTAWITHAQSLKPQSEMPDLTQFTGQQLQELVAYLHQLK